MGATPVRRILERWIQDVLRVPPEPGAPLGESLQVFRAGKGYYRYRLAGWLLSQVGTVAGLVVGVTFIRAWNPEDPMLRYGLLGLEGVSILFFLAFLPLSYMMVELDYKYRWYMVTDRSLRIREGLWKVRELTMTFSNIQNLSIRQGPFQRLFGIADLEVRTAGGGGSGSPKNDDPFVDNLHMGYFHGVDNAEAIRDIILAHLRRSGGAGLGDPDEEVEEVSLGPQPSENLGVGPATSEPEIVAVAKALLWEVQALRRVTDI